MDKKAGGEMDQFLESVWPDGYAPPTAAAKRPAAAASGAAKKAKVDPDNIDAKALALADKVGKLSKTVRQDGPSSVMHLLTWYIS